MRLIHLEGSLSNEGQKWGVRRFLCRGQPPARRYRGGMTIRFFFLISPEHGVGPRGDACDIASVWCVNNDDRCDATYNYSRNI